MDTKLKIKERPIIFSTELIPKILDLSKTQTRRVIKPQPISVIENIPYKIDGKRSDVPCTATELPPNRYTAVLEIKCPYGQVGDRLWVRESWKTEAVFDTTPPCDISHDAIILYTAMADSVLTQIMGRTRSPLHLPRWASRITLEITALRCERLQEITTEDIMAEGLESTIPYQGFVHRFKRLWNSLNPKYQWESNPFVWVIEFKVV